MTDPLPTQLESDSGESDVGSIEDTQVSDPIEDFNDASQRSRVYSPRACINESCQADVAYLSSSDAEAADESEHESQEEVHIGHATGETVRCVTAPAQPFPVHGSDESEPESAEGPHGGNMTDHIKSPAVFRDSWIHRTASSSTSISRAMRAAVARKLPTASSSASDDHTVLDNAHERGQADVLSLNSSADHESAEPDNITTAAQSELRQSDDGIAINSGGDEPASGADTEVAVPEEPGAEESCNDQEYHGWLCEVLHSGGSQQTQPNA